MPPSQRISELRRRLQADPESIAFAQLAEEYRRLGDYHQAIQWCRIGLAKHPGYLAARVTLGRALIELGFFDEAERELLLVTRTDPDNLPAIRALGETNHQRGNLEAALQYYKRALYLAGHDPDLDESVGHVGRELADHAPPPAPRPAEPLIDFDGLLASLGNPAATAPPQVEALLTKPRSSPPSPASHAPVSAPAAPRSDPFAALEASLRAMNGPPVEPPQDTALTEEDQHLVRELEAWLAAIQQDRVSRAHV